jgi:hypothetical protein
MAEQRTLDAERADFEAVADKYSINTERMKRFPDRYKYEHAEQMWQFWQEAGQAARRAPPALDAVGLPELEQSIDTPEFFQTVCDWANKVPDGPLWSDIVRLIHNFAGQAQRDARVDAEREIGLLKMVCEQLKARLASADALIESMATKADRAQIARQSAPEGAPVACEHKGERTTHWDYIRCSDCGAVKTDSGWGIAKNQWFKDKDEAEFYKKTGARPAAPTSASAQPADQNKMENNDE